MNSITKSNYIKISMPVKYAFFSAAVILLFSPNPFLSAFSILILLLSAKLLWKRGEPPILLAVFFFQWLQVVTKIFHYNMLGISISDMFVYGEGIHKAVLLSMLGLLALTLGMHIVQRRLPVIAADEIMTEAMKLSISRLWILYLASFTYAVSIRSFYWTVPQLTQVLYALTSIKWLFFYSLALTILAQKKKHKFLVIALTLEIVNGFSGFFSTFKEVFFVFIIALLTIHYRITRKTFKYFFAAFVTLFLLLIIWQQIKVDYRNFLNRGTGMQIIDVSFAERMGMLVQLTSELELKYETMANSLETLADRVAYVDFFGATIQRVPNYIPHEGGKLWMKAIKHILAPRLLFPDKPKLGSDSEITRRYTGILVAGESEGTSIGIGYMAESYIDFGPIGMLIPIFILGILWGFIYKYFLNNDGNKVISYGFAVAVLLKAYQYEINNVKLLGGMLMTFIVMAFFYKFCMHRVNLWILSK